MSHPAKNTHTIVLAAFVLVTISVISACQPKSEPKTANYEQMELVFIPGGEFLMGMEEGWDTGPVHAVYVDDFYMDRHEVTNAQYYAFCRETGRKLPEFWGITEFRCGPDFPDNPVVGVSWYDASAYAEWAGKRLPTEAEWEYAAKGRLVGKPYPYGDDLDSTMANFSSSGTVPVCSYTPNGYGLCDMAGNVVEWVQDYYDKEYYRVSPYKNPSGPRDGKFCVIRGGGWHSGKYCNRAVHRNALIPSWVDFAVGFRCVKDIKPEQ